MTDVVPNPTTGSTHVYVRQTIQGLSVYNAQLHVNVDRESRIMSVNNQFVPALGGSINAVAPTSSAAAAVARAAEHLAIALEATPEILEQASSIDRVTEVDPTGVSLEPITARLMFLPVRLGTVRLVWNFQIHTADGAHAYDFTVDADTGTVWTRFDWVASDQYVVYQQPVESPSHTTPAPPGDGRTLQFNPANATASPWGWHDTNGSSGAEFTIPLGNNVHAYEDRNNSNSPPPASTQPDCGPNLVCNFGIDLTQAPSQYIPAAVTNLFYWNNIIHDIQYQYGFTEAAGNFQFNNYGRGGFQGDAVIAEVQDGGGTNNANMLTPPDGFPPRMQMYEFTRTNPRRDGDLDNGIIVHEYGHGISFRLVGGPGNVSCLGNRQQPGEGLSDWWALAYTARPGDTGAMGRGIGTYAQGQGPTGPGFRPQRYSTDPAVNNYTYESINGLLIPHGVGSVWAQAAWEMYWALVDQHGFDPNLYNATGGAGNQRAMLYVNEGLQNTACNPTFLDVRDGILQAAQNNHGGQDVCLLWNSFAFMGMGTDAVSGGPNSTTPTNGFGVPAACVMNNSEISIADIAVVEGDSSTQMNFTVSLSSPSTQPVSVNYITNDGTATVANLTATTPMTIPTSGPATPYPSLIGVQTPGSTITKVTATLHGFGHTFPSDVDVLLVGPTGQSVVLMSDVGGGIDVSNLTLTFDDAGAPLPGTGTLTSGTYRPTNLPPTDVFFSPAPGGPYGSTLSAFNGTDPSGVWRLWVVDDTGIDGGQITGGWSLTFTPAIGPDYVATSGTLTFPPGTTTRTISVPVIGDTAHEVNEWFLMYLNTPVGATILDPQAKGTIVNDDGPPPPPTPPTTPAMTDVAVDFRAGRGVGALQQRRAVEPVGTPAHVESEPSRLGRHRWERRPRHRRGPARHRALDPDEQRDVGAAAPGKRGGHRDRGSGRQRPGGRPHRLPGLRGLGLRQQQHVVAAPLFEPDPHGHRGPRRRRLGRSYPRFPRHRYLGEQPRRVVAAPRAGRQRPGDGRPGWQRLRGGPDRLPDLRHLGLLEQQPQHVVPDAYVERDADGDRGHHR